MRLLSTEVRGLLSIREARIDYTELGQVVAFVGPNGAGKSSILEAPLAALYRRLVSHPDNVADLCTGRDAFVEAIFGDDDGTTWSARISVDAEKRKVEQHLLRNGKPVTTGRAAEVEKAVREHFGSLDALLASVFCAQDRSGEFTGLGRAERKALLVEALGLNKLQVACEAARARAVQADHGAASLREKVGALKRAQALVDQARADCEHTARDAAEAARAETDARQAVEAARATAHELSRVATEHQAALEAHRRAVQVQASASDRLMRATQALKRVENEVDQRLKRFEYRRDNLKTKAAREVQPVYHMAQMEQALHDATAAAVNADAAFEAARQEHATATREHGKAAGAMTAAAAEDAAELRHRVGLAQQAELLENVPCTAYSAWLEPTVHQPGADTKYVPLAGTCPLLAAATKAKGELDVPAAPSRHASAYEAALAADARVREAVVALQNAQAASAAAREAQRAALRTRDEALAGNARAEQANRESASAAQDMQALEEEASAALGSDCAALDDANGAKVQAQRDVEAADQELRETGGRKAALERQSVGLHEADVRLRAATLALQQANERLMGAERAHAKAEADLVNAEKYLAGLEGAPAELRAAEDELQDWEILEEALGRNGIQALEIDAAGPGIAEICNELLASCYGPRFSLRFDTLRQNRTNDGAQEVFDITVLDNGTERRLEQLSGGEKVIVREALALALAIWNARRGGVVWRTLFRDETSGALSEFNSLAYVTMLRKACELGGFVQVVFVSHQREVSARADSLVVVEGGTARVA